MGQSGRQQEEEEERESGKTEMQGVAFGFRNMFWREERADNRKMWEDMNAEIETIRTEVF